MVKRIVRRVVADSLVVYLSYTTAYLTVFLNSGEYDRILPVPWFWFFIIGIHISANATLGFYNRIWGSGSILEPLWLLVSTGLSTIALFAINILANPPVNTYYLLSVCVFGGVLTCAGFLLVRYRMFILHRFRINTGRELEPDQSCVLIVGMTREAQQLAVHLSQDDHRKFKIVGFIDNNAKHMDMNVMHWPVLGLPIDIPRVTEEKNVDIILLIQNGLNGIDLNDLISLCHETEAQIKILPDSINVLNDFRWDLSLLRDVTVEDLLERKPSEIDEATCSKILKGKVVLVTGASGSIGSELCRQVIKYEPSRLILLDNNESALHDLNIELKNKLNYPNTHMVLADITSAAKIKALFEAERPQFIFHAAAYKHVPMLEIYPEEAVRVNILGTMILSECAARYGTERFVFISTDKAVNPESVMGASKRVCEIWLNALNRIAGRTTFTIVRFGNVIGSRGSVVPIFKRQIEWGGPVTVTHKDMTRYFMSIPEAVSLVLHAMTLCNKSETYMLDMGKRISILDLAQRMIRVRGLRINDDIAIHFTGIRPGEKLHEELYYGAEVRSATEHSRIYSLSSPVKGPELKTVLGAILLLADVAQRQIVTPILRRALMMAAYQDWDTFIELLSEKGLIETYQPPAALLDSSILMDQEVVETFVAENNPDLVKQEAV